MSLAQATRDMRAAMERFNQIVEQYTQASKPRHQPPMWAPDPARTRRTASARHGYRRVK
ncbi:hypothetical protein [Prescottella equi]|uniref:hypothetical protein n=1 Tax=Rhodococcus hoagii TaxID=43767 RepID=UPI00131C73F7|nr:hypothetical protein [Prescottella equi]